MKTFLSYSREDKHYVDILATRLGRARVVYDRISFDPGYDFRELIKKGLDKSSFFIFFVSKPSLESTWVKFEITEAEWRIIQGQIHGAISIIIDEDIDIRDLPPWMQRSLVHKIVTPQVAFHTIQSYLIQEADSLRETFIIGRESDLSTFAQLLNPAIEESVPQIMVLTGLEGIGRKTFARRVLHDYLSLSIGAELVIGETDTSEKLYLDLMSETAEFNNRARVAEAIRIFRSMSAEEKGQEIARLIAIINQYNQVPVLRDKGPESTFLDKSRGLYKQEWLNILKGLKKFEDSYLLMIQPRLPYLTGMAQYETEIPKYVTYRLGPLSTDAIEFMLREGARRANIAITSEQIRELAPYMNGYPPAVKFALAYIQRYGASVSLANKATLNSFLARRFENLLARLELNEREQAVLRILASVSALPLDAIGVLSNSSDTQIAEIVTRLIDLSMVIPIDNEYMISAPISLAASRTFGPLNSREYAKIADVLKATYWTEVDKIPVLSIVDVTINALAYSNVEALKDFRDILLPSQILKAAWTKYHDRRWSDAEKLARRVLSLDPTLYSATVVLFKSLVRQRQWGPAEAVLRDIERVRQIDRFYLRGFYEWRRGHHDVAITLFKSGLNVGDRTFALLRDLAYCLFVMGQLPEATTYIKRALERNRNKFTVDLAAQIAIFSDEKDIAQDLLTELQELDRLMYHHRRATLKWKEGQYEEALADAEIACDTDYPVFEALVQRVDLLILLDKKDVEVEIRKLEQVVVEHSDIQRGLWCKYYLQKDEWGQAERWWNKIWQKSLPVYKELRKRILAKKIEDEILEPMERQKSVTELSGLKPHITLPLLSTDLERLEENE